MQKRREIGLLPDEQNQSLFFYSFDYQIPSKEKVPRGTKDKKLEWSVRPLLIRFALGIFFIAPLYLF